MNELKEIVSLLISKSEQGEIIWKYYVTGSWCSTTRNDKYFVLDPILKVLEISSEKRGRCRLGQGLEIEPLLSFLYSRSTTSPAEVGLQEALICLRD